MRANYLSKTLATASATAIATAQAVAGAGNLTLDGATVAAGIATLDTPRRVLITSAGNDAGITFTVYGTTNGTYSVSETVTGAAIGTVATQRDFLTIARVAASGAAAANVSVGTNTVGSSPWILVSNYSDPVSQGIAVVVTGTVNYSVEYTYDNFIDTTVPAAIPVVFTDPVLAAETTTGDTNFDTPFTGWRVTINSGSGSLAIKGIQAGVR